MIALVVRLVILGAVVFGVFFGVTRTFRSRADKKLKASLEEDLKALKASDASDLWDEDYDRDELSRQIITKAKRLGLKIPSEVQPHV
jgi:hypothetical protein